MASSRCRHENGVLQFGSCSFAPLVDGLVVRGFQEISETAEHEEEMGITEIRAKAGHERNQTLLIKRCALGGGIGFALLPNNRLQLAIFHRDPGAPDCVLVKPALMAWLPIFNNRSADRIRDQTNDGVRLGFGEGFSHGKAGAGPAVRFVEMERFGCRFPSVAGAEGKNPRMNLPIDGADLTAACHIRLADQQVKIHRFLRWGSPGRGTCPRK